MDSMMQPTYSKYVRALEIAFISIATVVVCFITMPLLYKQTINGLDPSWELALNMAFKNHLQFGKDIVFGFGPMGFVWNTMFYDFVQWTLSSSAALIAHIGLFFCGLVLVRKAKAGYPGMFLFLGVLLIAAGCFTLDYKLLIVASMMFYIVIFEGDGYRFAPYLLIAGALLLALVSLIKFSAALIGISMLLTMCVYFVVSRRQIAYFLLLIITYVAAFLILWFVCGQKLTNIPAYILNSYEISRGYDEAMTYPGLIAQVFLGAAVLLFGFALFCRSFIKRQNPLFWYMLLYSGFIFVSFKHGFVRHDDHVYGFFASSLLILTLLYILHKNQLGSFARVILYTLVVCIAINIGIKKSPLFDVFKEEAIQTYGKHVPSMKQTLSVIGTGIRKISFVDLFVGDLRNKVAEEVSDIEQAVALISGGDTYRQAVISDNKRCLKEFYGLTQKTIDYVRNRSVDVIPWEAAVAYAYDAKWTPRPVFQSYSAYTKKLDTLNAEFYQSDRAPDIVLYSLKSIDGRYPIFDEPATFQTLLLNYEPVSKDGVFIVLKRKSPIGQTSDRSMSRATFGLGKPLDVSQTEGYLFAKIDLEYTILGKLLRFFYKSPDVEVQLLLNDGEIKKYKFIASPAQNGIYLSQHIDSEDELIRSWNGTAVSNVNAIMLSARERIYKNDVPVEFMKVAGR